MEHYIENLTNHRRDAHIYQTHLYTFATIHCPCHKRNQESFYVLFIVFIGEIYFKLQRIYVGEVIVQMLIQMT